ncbi:MAG: hypothetical protein ACR2QZ_13325 [Woeseiaceae bacterium]
MAVKPDDVDPAPLVVAVTAHRNLVDGEIPQIVGAIRKFFEELSTKFPATPITLLSPLAEGGGRLAAKVAIEMNLRLLIPLPLPVDLYKADFQNAASVEEFESLCQQGTVIEMPLFNGNTKEGIEVPGLQRNYQYAQAGIFLSSYSHILLAIWDGKPSAALGGTAQVVDFHLTNMMPGLTGVEPAARRLFGRHEDDLVYHIVCARDQPDGSPARPLQSQETSWLTSDKEISRTKSLPESANRIFTRMDEFNTDAERHSSKISNHDCDLIAPNLIERHSDRKINSLFKVADWLAIFYQKRVLAMFRSTYTLAFGMGLAFILYGEFPSQTFMIHVFLSLFGIGLVIYLIAQRGRWHRKYLDYRALAEGLRVQLYWRLAGIREGTGIQFTHENFLQEQDIELGWIRNVMRAGSIPFEFSPPPANGLDEVIRHWFEDAPTGQLNYYRGKAFERERRSLITRGIGIACLCLGLAVAVFLAFYNEQLPSDVRNPLIVLMGVLPLVAAVQEAYAHKKAERELIKQYRFMERVFANAKSQLDSAASDHDKRAILKALGGVALDEHAEWILMHRERPLEYGKL